MRLLQQNIDKYRLALNFNLIILWYNLMEQFNEYFFLCCVTLLNRVNPFTESSPSPSHVRVRVRSSHRSAVYLFSVRPRGLRPSEWLVVLPEYVVDLTITSDEKGRDEKLNIEVRVSCLYFSALFWSSFPPTKLSSLFFFFRSPQLPECVVDLTINR